MTPREEVRRALAQAHRREWARVLAATVRVAGDLDLAQECAQDAYVRALETWQRDGVPPNPGAWLTTTARNRAVDSHRRAAALRGKLPLLVEEERTVPGPGWDEAQDGADGRREVPDDRLRLVFTCCHPALAREAQVALTLRLVCGLTTDEIAAAFLVSESTMAARITRAKKKITAARIPYRVPAGHELAERLDAVLMVLHLVFTTGHTAPSGGALRRSDLTGRAVDLTRTLLELMPDERELRGLLALMVFGEARAATRVDDAGAFVPLEEQDRGRWDAAAIRDGCRLLQDALHGGRPGRFVLQAAIAAFHATAPSFDDTDWRGVAMLYDRLLAEWPSPVVALNRAIAVGFRDGPQAGLAALDELESGALAGYHYLPAARAELLRRLGEPVAATHAYAHALELVDNERERDFLERRLASMRDSSRPAGTSDG
ncbi:MAG TPA: sigma-70 family RNA polymerase sigma factor [Intrasporangium sp.]|uniref:RNA polymerase sigma factor n=1 Tax=Intrasporangium sp. TaxID=1925024 RepID=UPI002D76B740|nr:sigma-70 family RNA polymerase sigma factor [Intrasporangium sp.]HET7397611.1 sigma-70 family RNA polymerase sigma factor [Intrasporangium sp.]